MKIRDLFSSPGSAIAYHPRIAHFLGGKIKAALLLCQFIYWRGRGWDKEGWIYKTRKELYCETAMTRGEQESARELLRARGYLEEKLKGIPRKVYYRLNVSKLESDWSDWMRTKPLEGLGETRPQGSKKRVISMADFRPSITETTKEHQGDYIAAGNQKLLKRMRV